MPKPSAISRAHIEKVVINAGIGRASQQTNFEDKILPQIIRDVSAVAGQKPQVRRARKSIAGFKIREGQVVGLKVTLRRQKMIDFLTRLFTIVLPRVRDFNGIRADAVDEGGALNIGFQDQYVFPEISPEESGFAFSLGVNLVPRKRKRPQNMESYREMGVPFKK
ncbi:MAG: 50S ribosomal protein L5 [Candidatus Liptonbacteria bacterium]